MHFFQIGITFLFVNSFCNAYYWYPLCGSGKCSVFSQLREITFKSEATHLECCLKTSINEIAVNTLTNTCNPISCLYTYYVKPAIDDLISSTKEAIAVYIYKKPKPTEYFMEYYCLLIGGAVIIYLFMYYYLVQKLIDCYRHSLLYKDNIEKADESVNEEIVEVSTENAEEEEVKPELQN